MTPPPSSIDTPRLTLVAGAARVSPGGPAAGTGLLHAAELGDATALGPLLGAEVPADWPPADGEYDRDAIGYFLRQLTKAPDGIGWARFFVLHPPPPGGRPGPRAR